MSEMEKKFHPANPLNMDKLPYPTCVGLETPAGRGSALPLKFCLCRGKHWSPATFCYQGERQTPRDYFFELLNP